MNVLRVVAALMATSALASCAASSTYFDDQTTIEMYRVFDIKTAADSAAVGKAASDGLRQNKNFVNENMPLQRSAEIPERPGRFAITEVQWISMLKRGTGSKMAKCEGAVWSARARLIGSNDVNLYSCLYQYKTGYHLDTYSAYKKEAERLYLVQKGSGFSMIKTPEEWVNKTVLDMLRSIEIKAKAKITFVEGQPLLGGAKAVSVIN